MSAQSEALRLFTHQLLNHEGNPDGVHLGCDDLEVCKQSHVDGETSPVIHEWVDAAELRRLHAENERLYAQHASVVSDYEIQIADLVAQRDALLEALRKHVYLHDKDCVCEDCAAIKQAEGENT